MKILLLAFLSAAFPNVSMCAEELFSAYCKSALTGNSYPTWKVIESKKGLSVVFTEEKKRQFSAMLSTTEADKLRARIVDLRFTQADVEVLRSLSVTLPAKENEEESITLRPFDGVTYHFLFSSNAGQQKVEIDNPAFDLEHHPHVAQCDRLNEVLTLLELIERRAKGAKDISF